MDDRYIYLMMMLTLLTLWSNGNHIDWRQLELVKGNAVTIVVQIYGLYLQMIPRFLIDRWIMLESQIAICL